jgi:hypothetical protein
LTSERRYEEEIGCSWWEFIISWEGGKGNEGREGRGMKRGRPYAKWQKFSNCLHVPA